MLAIPAPRLILGERAFMDPVEIEVDAGFLRERISGWQQRDIRGRDRQFHLALDQRAERFRHVVNRLKAHRNRHLNRSSSALMKPVESVAFVEAAGTWTGAGVLIT